MRGSTTRSRKMFESQYPLPSGMSYNSYVVAGSTHSAILDSVDAEYGDEWLDNLTAALEAVSPTIW